MIRKATKNDFPFLLSIINELDKGFTVNDFIQNPYSKYYLLEENHNIIGILGYAKIYERMELEYIYILNSYRGQGFSKQLMDFLLKEAKMMEIDSITLEVNAQNEVAIHLYQTYGFDIVSVRDNYYNGQDGYLMFRKL